MPSLSIPALYGSLNEFALQWIEDACVGQLHLNLPLPADAQKRVPTIHLDFVGTAFLPSVMLRNLDAIALDACDRLYEYGFASAGIS